MPELDWDQVDHLVEIRGLGDAWSIAVMKDGTVINRWAGQPGYERRAEQTEAYIAGVENGL